MGSTNMRIALFHLLPGIMASAVALVGCTSNNQTTTNGSDSESGIATTQSPTTLDPPICEPGIQECLDAKTVGICASDGREYIELPCGPKDSCIVGECHGPCYEAELSPSSTGCSFIAARMYHYNQSEADVIIVGNNDAEVDAEVQLYHTPDNIRLEVPLGDPIILSPGETYAFPMENTFIGESSAFRTGGSYRVESDSPIVAYQHSPRVNVSSNDASMLLPEHTLRQDYVVYSYPGFEAELGQPSYVAIIALEHKTKVTWTAKTDTAGDMLPVPFVFAGDQGEMELNERDMLQLAASSNEEDVRKRDLSGMVIHADKPIWVVGATSCAYVPFGGQGFCDHLQEQLIPIEQWGREYVAAHSPVRGTEKHVWRIYAGADNVGVATEPPLDGTPFVLDKTGDYREFEVDNGVSFVVTSNGPIMPVQYLYGSQDGAGTGDPSMYQMVPVEQFLRRYAFATGLNYDDDYVQVTRTKGGADVLVDGAVVTGYYQIGDYEVADWKVEEGAHFAESSQSFGIAGVGYTQQNASYAYPGGLALEVISPL